MAAQRRPEGPPAAPAVQRLRIRYAKRGRLRFSSTRDFQRALERALRRAAVPMAYSSGFHPHPKISYANAAPTGTASEAEYVEIALAERVDPQALRTALDAALPPGLDLVEVCEAGPGSLADRLEASVWRLAFPAGADGPEVAELTRAVAAYQELPQAAVTRVLKTGPREIDTRAAVLHLRVTDGLGEASYDVSQPAQAQPTAGSSPGEATTCAILTMVVRHTTPAVRPDDILTALRTHAALDIASPPLVTRLAQGPLLDGGASVADPLAIPVEVTGVETVPRQREPFPA